MNTHIRAFRRAAHSLDHLKHTETDDRPRVSSNFTRKMPTALTTGRMETTNALGISWTSPERLMLARLPYNAASVPPPRTANTPAPAPSSVRTSRSVSGGGSGTGTGIAVEGTRLLLLHFMCAR